MSFSPRSLRRLSAPKDTRPFINLFKFDFPDSQPKRIRLPKEINELLVLATEVLELQRPAKQVFDKDLNPITDMNQIEANMDLLISCANPINDNIDDGYKSRLPKYHLGTLKKLPIVKQPASKNPKPTRDDLIQQQAVAASKTTYRQNLRNSLLSIYAILPPEHQSALPPKAQESLEKLSKETKQFAVEDSLLSQFISPSSVISNTPLGQETTNWMLDQFKGLSIDQCQFIINGPSQSGKSVLLSIATSLFYQKLQVANEVDNYLFFPINFLMNQLCIHDISKLYYLFITTFTTMLKGSRLELIPIINHFHQWLISLIDSSALLPLPSPVLRFPEFPSDMTIKLGRKIHELYHQKKFSAFLTEMINFPNMIAKAFHYKSVIYIFDHFDAFAYTLHPSEHFVSSKDEPVAFPELLCRTIANSPYIVASQNDTEFYQWFTLVEQSKQLSTEYLIQNEGEKEIFVQQTPITLNMEMCRGCPAYCNKFIELCDLIEKSNQEAAVKSQYSKLKSIIDASRNEMIQHQFVRLCLLLARSDTNDTFDDDKINHLISLPEITLKLR